MDGTPKAGTLHCDANGNVDGVYCEDGTLAKSGYYTVLTDYDPNDPCWTKRAPWRKRVLRQLADKLLDMKDAIRLWWGTRKEMRWVREKSIVIVGHRVVKMEVVDGSLHLTVEPTP